MSPCAVTLLATPCFLSIGSVTFLRMQTGSHKHNRASQTLVMFNVCWLEKVFTIVSIVIHPCLTILLFNSFILAAVLKTLAVPTPQFLLGFWHLLIGLNCPRVRPHGKKKSFVFSYTLLRCGLLAFPFSYRNEQDIPKNLKGLGLRFCFLPVVRHGISVRRKRRDETCGTR